MKVGSPHPVRRRLMAAAVTAAVTAGLLAAGVSPVEAKKKQQPVDRKAPAVTVMSGPAHGATVSGVVTIEATASDASGIGSVQLVVNGKVVATDTGSPFTLTVDSSRYKGAFSWQVRATDRKKNAKLTKPRVAKVAKSGKPKPSPSPTVTPSPVPSDEPTEAPTELPTDAPTETPVDIEAD